MQPYYREGSVTKKPDARFLLPHHLIEGNFANASGQSFIVPLEVGIKCLE